MKTQTENQAASPSLRPMPVVRPWTGRVGWISLGVLTGALLCSWHARWKHQQTWDTARERTGVLVANALPEVQADTDQLQRACATLENDLLEAYRAETTAGLRVKAYRHQLSEISAKTSDLERRLARLARSADEIARNLGVTRAFPAAHETAMAEVEDQINDFRQRFTSLKAGVDLVAERRMLLVAAKEKTDAVKSAEKEPDTALKTELANLRQEQMLLALRIETESLQRLQADAADRARDVQVTTPVAAPTPVAAAPYYGYPSYPVAYCPPPLVVVEPICYEPPLVIGSWYPDRHLGDRASFNRSARFGRSFSYRRW